jgi:hypothetical protein
MNRRQIINKILHDHIDVNKHEDYTNYKNLITAIEVWHESEVKNLLNYNNNPPLKKRECTCSGMSDKVKCNFMCYD